MKQQPAITFIRPLDGRVYDSTLVHVVAALVFVLLICTACSIWERTLSVNRSAAVAIGLTERQRMLSQRIAGLTGRYALGSTAQIADLRSAIEEFAAAQRRLLLGDTSHGVRRLSADPALRAIYFAGNSPLDGAIRTFLTDARRISATPADAPLSRPAAERIFVAARRPLLDRLDAAVLVRETQLQQTLALLHTLGLATMLAFAGALGAYALGVVRPMARRAADVARQHAELARVATTDPLTGALNTRSFHDRGAVEIQKARRYNRPLSLLMIDPDQLATINEIYGPEAGDTMLKALTATLLDGTRTTDLIGRVGEEFGILLPETGAAGAELLAERLRHKIGSLSVPIDNSVVSSTVSIGVAAAEQDAAFFGPTLARADDALYEAKIRGRNRVFVNAVYNT